MTAGVPKLQWEPGIGKPDLYPNQVVDLLEEAAVKGQATAQEVTVRSEIDDQWDVVVDGRSFRCFTRDDAQRLLMQVLR